MSTTHTCPRCAFEFPHPTESAPDPEITEQRLANAYAVCDELRAICDELRAMVAKLTEPKPDETVGPDAIPSPEVEIVEGSEPQPREPPAAWPEGSGFERPQP